jgi:hypothetical protein
MAFQINGIEFDEGQDPPTVSMLAGSLPTVVAAYLHSLDFGPHGITVVQVEPNPGNGFVRHVTFVPYANLQKVQQDYITAEEG